MVPTITYGFGSQAALDPKEEAQKFENKKEAAQAAMSMGYSFIVEYKKLSNGEVYKSILTWDAKVISHEEAKKLYGKEPDKMNIIINAKPTAVFIVTPIGANAEEIVFPFTPFNRLAMVHYTDLV